MLTVGILCHSFLTVVIQWAFSLRKSCDNRGTVAFPYVSEKGVTLWSTNDKTATLSLGDNEIDMRSPPKVLIFCEIL